MSAKSPGREHIDAINVGSLASGGDPTRRSSYRKLRMLPWCKDERDEIVHTEYIHFLAQMNA